MKMKTKWCAEKAKHFILDDFFTGGEVISVKDHDKLVGQLQDQLTLVLSALSEINSGLANLKGRTDFDLDFFSKTSQAML